MIFNMFEAWFCKEERYLLSMQVLPCNESNYICDLLNYCDYVDNGVNYSCFSDFVFKIRLIRLGFSLQKTKNSCTVFELTTY